MYIPSVLMAASLLEFALPVHAQNVPVYKVEFNIRDGLEGKPHPSLHYSLLLDESRRAVFQAANRLPLDGGSPQYVDVGVNIELAVRASAGKVMLDGAIEFSSVTGQVCMGSLCEPIVAQRKMAFHATLELATPTVIADDRKA
jgi:hypothetical protein